MSGATFAVDRDESFTIIVAEDHIGVYERYEDAVTGITETIADDADCFVAEVAITSTNGEDVSVALEQVSWQQIIRDMVVTNGN